MKNLFIYILMIFHFNLPLCGCRLNVNMCVEVCMKIILNAVLIFSNAVFNPFNYSELRMMFLHVVGWIGKGSNRLDFCACEVSQPHRIIQKIH